MSKTLALLMILKLLDEVDGGDTQKKQLTNPHVELRTYEIKYCWFGNRDFEQKLYYLRLLASYLIILFLEMSSKSVYWHKAYLIYI